MALLRFPDLDPITRCERLEMQKTVVARIYLDQSIEYCPPPDSLQPPGEGELRVTLESDQMHHLEIFNDRQWVDLGETTPELLKSHGLDPETTF